jgi:membrane protein
MNNFVRQQSERLAVVAQTVEMRARKLSIINLLFDTSKAYSDDNCSMIAAALSYYALLSIFPLMLFLIALASTFIPADRVTRFVVGFVSSDFPLGARTLQTALEQAIQARGVISVVSAASFLWSAMGVFDMLQRGINRAFRVQQPRPKWRQTIVSMAMVASIGLLFAISFGLTTWLRVAFHFRMLLRTSIAVDLLADVVGFAISVAVFSLLYQYIPFGENLKWRDILLGALVASALWYIAKIVFAWYITSYASLNLVYGPLGTVIAIMLWGYVTAAILLLGAELTAIKSGAHQRQRRGDEWWALTAR